MQAAPAPISRLSPARPLEEGFVAVSVGGRLMADVLAQLHEVPS